MTTFTPEQKLTIVKHLASGKSAEVVAVIIKASETDVIDVAKHHGYPDVDKLTWAADIMQKNLDASDQPTASTVPANAPVLADRPGTTPVKPSTLPPVAGKPDEVRALIAAAKGHPAKKIQAQADRALDTINRLRQLLVEDEQKNHERRKAAAEKARAKADVERLKAELAAAQAKLRGTTPPKAAASTAASGPSAAQIRTWAGQNGIECPRTGRVPAEIREAYDHAHQDEVA